MIPVHQSRSTDGAYTFVLPGTWAVIPLDTPEAARAAAQKVVRERVGRDDRLATLRRNARDELMKTAADAVRGGADGLWLSLEILPGIPLPASMVTSFIGGDASPDVAAAEKLRRLRPAGEILETAAGPVVRSRATAPSRVDADRQSLALEYIVPSPVPGVFLAVNGSAGVIEDGEPYTALFDTVVDSLRWSAEFAG